MIEQTTLTLEWPWLLCLLPLPLLCYWLLPPRAMEQVSALKVPFFSSLVQLIAASHQQKNHQMRYWIWLGFIWTSLVFAATNPMWVGAPIAIEQSGRDILLALDLSPSMSNPDMVSGQNTVTRLSLVKMAAQHFIDGRKGDRLGLIVFGEQAYLMTPLTLDHQTLKEMMDDSTAGLAGERTAIGDAIGLGVKRLLPYPKNSRVLIMFTDGANNAGAIDPIAAAKEAAKLGIKIYTVGLGANEMMIHDIFGLHPVNPSSDLDENSLKEIARLTGGRYFRATDKDSLLNALNEMDKLEPSLNDLATYRPQTVLYPIILIGAALLMLFGVLAQLRLNQDRASEMNQPDYRQRGLS